MPADHYHATLSVSLPTNGWGTMSVATRTFRRIFVSAAASACRRIFVSVCGFLRAVDAASPQQMMIERGALQASGQPGSGGRTRGHAVQGACAFDQSSAAPAGLPGRPSWEVFQLFIILAQGGNLQTASTLPALQEVSTPCMRLQVAAERWHRPMPATTMIGSPTFPCRYGGVAWGCSCAGCHCVYWHRRSASAWATPALAGGKCQRLHRLLQ